MSTEKNTEEATGPVEAPALSQLGATFAERAAASAARTKAVPSDESENKAVKSVATKQTRKSAR